MHARQRARFVAILVEDIARMPADFETFGYRIIDRLQPDTWDHRGTNVSGFPVKSVVDSMAGVVKAAEYTIQKDYFTDEDHEKLLGDIRHAVTTHSTVKNVWLLSSMLATGGEMTRARGLVATMYSHLSVEILDARRIANFIVENLDNDAFVRSIEGYLPVLAAVRHEHALSHQIPPRDGYVERPVDEQALHDALTARRVVVLSGVSGAGKSALAATVAERIRSASDYDLVLWQDAEHLKDVEALRTVSVDRFGEPANLLGFLDRRKCLVVLDNLSVGDIPEKIVANHGVETRVLATSQVAGRKEHRLELGSLERALARKVLTRDLDDCPDDTFDAVYAAVGGHPLLLNLLNAVVTEAGDWTLAKQYSADAHELEDDRRQRICQRILEQHLGVLRREFELIRWCDSPVVDEALLRELCGMPALDKLSRRHFISGRSRGTVRVNDLVFESVRAVVDRRPDAER